MLRPFHPPKGNRHTVPWRWFVRANIAKVGGNQAPNDYEICTGGDGFGRRLRTS